jgi:formamidopyrimidine-DNA glycosylase
MPELPEIFVFARDMRRELVGRTLRSVEVLQPKSLNVPPQEFQAALRGAEIRDVTPRGKWLQVETTQGWLLLNLGMGGEILLVGRGELPEKRRLIFDLGDAGGAEGGVCLVVNFWWFGYAHYTADLAEHEMTARLGPDALGLTLAAFADLLRGRRGAIKHFLLNQRRIAGIGNVYVQDPLFKAGIHPLRKIDTLSEEEVAALWRTLQETLREGIAEGGSSWELNLYGEKGGWDERFRLVAYREGQPCPACGTTVEKIKTGSTSSYVCPTCQALRDQEGSEDTERKEARLADT